MPLQTRLATATQNAACDATVARANGGTVEVRSGTQPASANDAATGTLLATLTLSATAFGAAAAGVATANAITGDSSIDATGTASWFRVKTSGAATAWDGSVGTATSDMILNSVSLTAGGTLNISSWTFTQPAL